MDLDELKSFMNIHAPIYFLRLRELHLSRYKAWEKLKRELKEGDSMYGGPNGFTKACRGCASNVDYEGHMARLRADVAQTIIEAVEKMTSRAKVPIKTVVTPI